MIPLQQCVPEVLAAVLGRQPLTPAKVAFAWSVAVGPALTRATSVSLDDRGALRVATADARWRAEVERSSRLILARLERLLGPGVVRRLVCGETAA